MFDVFLRKTLTTHGGCAILRRVSALPLVRNGANEAKILNDIRVSEFWV